MNISKKQIDEFWNKKSHKLKTVITCNILFRGNECFSNNFGAVQFSLYNTHWQSINSLEWCGQNYYLLQQHHKMAMIVQHIQCKIDDQ